MAASFPNPPADPNRPDPARPGEEPLDLNDIDEADADWFAQLEADAKAPASSGSGVDLRELFGEANEPTVGGPSSFARLAGKPVAGPPSDDVGDVLGASPRGVDAVAPASGWFDSAVRGGKPAPSHQPEEPSDIFSQRRPAKGGGSDVLRVNGTPGASSSNIFDAPPEGSSRFSHPADATDRVLGSGRSLADRHPPTDPDSDAVTGDGAYEELEIPFSLQGGETCLPTGGHAGGPTEVEIDFPDSGIDLLNPDSEAGTVSLAGPDSSIFHTNPSDRHAPELDGSPLMMPGDSGEMSNSALFPHELKPNSFDIFAAIPPAAPGQRSSGANRAGPRVPDEEQIEWDTPHVGGDPAQVSQRMTAEEADEVGIPLDLGSFSRDDLELADFAVVEDAAGFEEVDAPKAVAAPLAPPARGFTRPVDARPKPARERAEPSRNKGNALVGWLGGTALGLTAGVGGMALAYFTIAPQAQTATAPSPAPVPPTPAAPAAGMTLAEARALLAAGEPAWALPTLVAAGADAPSDVVADRGKARWQVRVRELARGGQRPAADDAVLKEAEADFRAVLANPAEGDAQRQAAVEATLYLGLTREVVGDPAGAAAVYADGAARFPESKAVYEASLNRLKAVTPPAAGKGARLAPAEAFGLAQALGVALLLAPADAEPMAREAGEKYWEAANAAAAGDYAAARAAIAEAKKLHEARRLALVGRGLNPLSDPLEQIFSRCCDDLRDYWQFKQDAYSHPVAGPLFAKLGVAKGLDELGAKAKPDPAMMAASAASAAKVAELTKALAAEKVQSTAQKEAAAEEAAKLRDEAEKATASLTAATKAAAEQAATLKAAMATAAEAQAQLKGANATLAKVVTELQTAKLVDAGDDAKAVLAKFPEVVQKLAARGDNPDAAAAMASLNKAKKEVEAAKAATTTAEAKLAEADKQARAAAAQAEAELAKRTRAMDAEKAIAAERQKRAEADYAGKLAQAEQMRAQADQTAAALRLQLTEQAAQHQRQLAAARAQAATTAAQPTTPGANPAATPRATPLSSGETRAADRALELYSAGLISYFDGNYAAAEQAFTQATDASAADARFWYYLGLARRMQGKDATQAFQTGAGYERQGSPGARDIDAALERIQFAPRQAVDKYRPAR